MANAGRSRGHLALREALALVGLWSVLCAATATAGPPSGVVAVVDGQSITAKEFEHWYGVAAKSGGNRVPHNPPRFRECVADKHATLPHDGRGSTRKQLRRQCSAEHHALVEQVMQLLISFRWIRGEAEAQDITVTPSEVRAQFREQKHASFPKQKDYEKFLRASGQSEQDILMRVELDLLSSELRDRVTSDMAPVTNKQIKQYYELNRDRFMLPERRNLLVVLAKTKRNAAAARARIQAGERWATVAKALSIDPASRSQGGKLRWVAQGQPERAFSRALFAAKQGELQGPVRTRFGWYVFKVTKIKPAIRQSLEQASGTIRILLRSQGQQQALDEFVQAFTKRWRRRTICRRGYRTSDCANGPEAPGSVSRSYALLDRRAKAD